MSLDRYVCYIGRSENRDCDVSCENCGNYGPDRRLSDRRNKRLCFRAWERRKGFDRRQNHLKNKGFYRNIFRQGAFHLRGNNSALILLLIIFNILNMADFAFTLKALSAGHTEANPIMDKLFGIGPGVAGIFKITVGLSITLVVWLFRNYRLVLEASILILIMYMALTLYHIYGAIRYY